MTELTEPQKNLKRFKLFSKVQKDAANEIAFNEFLKPIKNRCTAVSILDKIEFEK